MQTANDMNTVNSSDQPAANVRAAGDENSFPAAGAPVSLRQRVPGFLAHLIYGLFRGEQRPPSILRNNTNLPVFLALALGLSLVCNFVLKESSAQASRVLGPAATLQEAQELVARNPEEPSLHSRVGELYLQQRNFKRAMFHFREASRLSELYGE